MKPSRVLIWEVLGFVIVVAIFVGLALRGESTRRLIEHPSQKAICRDFQQVGYRCPHHPRPKVQAESLAQGGDASQPAHNAGQKHAPAPAGGRKPKGKPKPKPTDTSPPAVPVPTPTAPVSEAPPAPGNSAQAPGNENGVKACVDAVVSACVKTDLPQLP